MGFGGVASWNAWIEEVGEPEVLAEALSDDWEGVAVLYVVGVGVVTFRSAGLGTAAAAAPLPFEVILAFPLFLPPSGILYTGSHG